MGTKNGYTLIELMIVVVVIGLLAALAVPKFTVASWKAMEKEADMLLKQVYSLQGAYVLKYGSQATSADHLLEMGFVIPVNLQYYEIPDPNGYQLPLCIATKGSWPSRQIDLNGNISDC